MTVQEAYPLFMAHGRAERQYAKQTLWKHKECFQSWLLPHLGLHPVAEVSRIDILAFRGKMTDAKLSANRQYSILMTLKLFLKFCQKGLRLNGLDPNEIRLPKRPKPYVQYLTNEEVEQVRQSIPVTTFTGLRLRVLVEVLLTTGLRTSEALALDRGPFEEGKTELEIVGKGGKPRKVFFSAPTITWIKKFLYYRCDDYPAVFITTGIPRRLDRSDISKFFKALKLRAGIGKPLAPHILRHTYCTNLLRNGADITYIKELAGHSDIQTTAKYYLGIDEDALRNVVNKYLNYEVGKSPPALDELPPAS
jgi:site-specific recombinase XerD